MAQGAGLGGNVMQPGKDAQWHQRIFVFSRLFGIRRLAAIRLGRRGAAFRCKQLTPP